MRMDKAPAFTSRGGISGVLLCAAAAASPLPSMATTINTVTITGTNGSAGVAAQPAYATAANGDPGQLATAVGGSGGTFNVNSTGSTTPSAGYVGAAAGAYAGLNPSSAYTPPGTALQGTATATGGAGGLEVLLVQNGSTQYFAGAGGSATAKVQTSASGVSIGGAVTASATAAGGSGGYIYDPSGIHSGNGGNASASGYVVDQQEVPLTISVKAVGGNAGEPSPNAVTTGDGSGGTAQISAEGISRGGAVNVSGTAIGGNGQNGVKETLSNTVSGQTTGALTLSQTAIGGNALGVGGLGGYASSTLTRQYTSSTTPQPSSLSLTVNATGGNGGPASGSMGVGNGGAASISAFGALSNGGAVSVSGTATGGSGLTGANENLNNAVSGETTGALTLSQTATGGNALGAGGTGGNATSTLTDDYTSSTAPQPSSLSLTVKAIGGPASGSVAAGNAGAASISALGTLTDGGAVSVSGTAIGGSGQNGVNEILNNVVSGQTTGALTLSQTAIGGGALGAGGAGGNATSALTEDYTSGTAPQPSSLSLTVKATGGNGGPASGSVAAGNAGVTSISAFGALSNGGAVSVSGTATGASGTNGANEILNNAVGGQTARALTLSQTAIGGNALGAGGAGGYASSALTEEYTSSAAQPSSLSLTVTAEAGVGGTATYSSPAGAGGNAAISATGSLRNGGAVTIVGEAAAGSGGSEVTGSAGGAAGQLITTENSLFGSSNGGAVNVSGLFYGGSGQNGANVNLSNVVGGQTTGALTLAQTAYAGEALNYGGTAGYASSKLDEQYASTSPQPSSLSLTVKATGGLGGQADTSIAAQAGGNAAVSATGSLTDGGAVSISGYAAGGDGGEGWNGNDGAGGQVVASTDQLFGSSNGGAVSVSGYFQVGAGQNGPNETLSNVVGGQTTGALTLSQTAVGGNALGAGGTGGNASSTLTEDYISGTAPQPSSLSLTVNAHGGSGGPGNSSTAGGAGGSATVSAIGSLTDGGAVSISGYAAGGDEGSNGNGYGAGGQVVASTDQLFGSSNGGAVSVSGYFRGGIGQNGANETLSNVVGGQTTGALTLSQTAVAGNADGAGVAGGNASSTLTQQYTSSTAPQPSSLSLTVNADGGSGGPGNSSTAGGAGGSATVSAIGSLTDGGAVTINGAATGGPGGLAGQAGVAVAAANSLFGSSNTGPVSVSGYFTGGDGVNNGGDESLVNAVGGMTTGALVLKQLAFGGSGYQLGGSASSTLDQQFAAGSQQPSSLSLTAVANGGNGGYSVGSADGGGYASASASGTLADGGAVTAVGEATGGRNFAGGSNGGATASATAATSSGAVNVEALASLSGPSHSANVEAAVNVGGQPVAPSPINGSRQAAAYATALPSQATVSGLYAGTSNFAVSGGAYNQVLGVATLSGQAISGTPGLNRKSETTWTISPGQLASSQQELLLGYDGASYTGTGEVDFQVTQDGNPLINQQFTNFGQAASYFNNQTVDLGSMSSIAASGGTTALNISMDVVGGTAGSLFTVNSMAVTSAVAANAPISMGGKYAGYSVVRDFGSNDRNTDVQFLGGTASTSTTLAVSFSSAPTTATNLISDIVNISGTNSDRYVVQLSYNPSLVTNGALSPVLAWKMANGSWVAAYLGDIGSSVGTEINGAYVAGSGAPVGTYGIDTAAHTVWAVLNYSGSSLTDPLGQFAVMQRTPGDTNGDGTVNLQDFLTLKSNFGTTDQTWSQGNFLGTSTINLQDFLALKANFGSGATLSSVNSYLTASTATPEPAAVLLLLGGASVLMLKRRRAASRGQRGLWSK